MSANFHHRPVVLAVDDSPLIHQLIREALGQYYHVLVADNANTALATLYQEPIQVLLLDVTMPEVDGLELCRTVRTLPQFHTLPIVMLTSRDAPFDRVQGRMAGASEYLTKPFDAEELRQVVQKFVAVASTPAIE
ncbi:response regulator [Trichothermofontia sichuanensis B231]|uniref:response regulator n=1 Tax=Trichothermofontia sichuanensis TaxID=3045816 RepID=UPI00224569BE|nr:response regulator [Trichothermofontia sichuanensis]UZQ55115.1 response regulator [Trichothermofontia sichuanensis B231]